MKFNLITSIGVALVGTIIAFFVTNLIVQDPEPYTLDVISSSSSDGYDYSNYNEPDNEVFNYDALNPTVEVYVGDCKETNANGECVDVTVPTEECAEGEDCEATNENGEENTGSEENGQENG